MYETQAILALDAAKASLGSLSITEAFEMTELWSGMS